MELNPVFPSLGSNTNQPLTQNNRIEFLQVNEEPCVTRDPTRSMAAEAAKPETFRIHSF